MVWWSVWRNGCYSRWHSNHGTRNKMKSPNSRQFQLSFFVVVLLSFLLPHSLFIQHYDNSNINIPRVRPLHMLPAQLDPLYTSRTFQGLCYDYNYIPSQNLISESVQHKKYRHNKPKSEVMMYWEKQNNHLRLLESRWIFPEGKKRDPRSCRCYGQTNVKE